MNLKRKIIRNFKNTRFLSLFCVAFSIFFLSISLLSKPELCYAANENTKVHFLTVHGWEMDAILLESTDASGSKHFAMVDSGEDSSYPDGSDPRYPARSGIVTDRGVEKEVIAYLKKVGVTSKNFEFYIGTHAHSDHIGTASNIISEFKPKKLYIREYKDRKYPYQNGMWDSQYNYDKALEAAKSVGCKIITNFDTGKTLKNGNPYEKLGDNMQIELLNIEDNKYIHDLNEISICVKIKTFKRVIFLGGDLNNYSMIDPKTQKEEGKRIDYLIKTGSIASDIDILKLNHHGEEWSNPQRFYEIANPAYIVQTGDTNILETDILEYCKEKGTYLYSTSCYANQQEALVFTISADSSIKTNIPKGKKNFVTEEAMTPSFVTLNNGKISNITSTMPNGWFESNGKWYFGKKGALATGWTEVDKKWYYMGASGVMITDWNLLGENWYYFNSNGDMATGWKKIEDIWYYFGQDGAMCTGWKKIDNLWYYFKSDGSMAIEWKKIDENWYYFKSTGIMANSWQQIDGQWCYFGQTGVMCIGWKKIDNLWYYFNSDGSMAIEWKKIEEKWYYFKSNGILASSWKKIDNLWYYFKEDGTMVTGWKKIDGSWYYFKPTGVMANDWQKIDNQWYYFNSTGIMCSGWKKIEDSLYYFKADGVMAIGWQKIDNQWYYFKSNGIMHTGWKKIDGNWYYFQANGARTTGWMEESGKKYYFRADGSMVTGMLNIGGIDYNFTYNGECIQL